MCQWEHFQSHENAVYQEEVPIDDKQHGDPREFAMPDALNFLGETQDVVVERERCNPNKMPVHSMSEDCVHSPVAATPHRLACILCGMSACGVEMNSKTYML